MRDQKPPALSGEDVATLVSPRVVRRFALAVQVEIELALARRDDDELRYWLQVRQALANFGALRALARDAE